MSQLRAYLELLRLPALFTAVADVLMGYLVTHTYLGKAEDLILADGTILIADPATFVGWQLAMLLVVSACFYLAGMVLNDVFDHQLDLVERPERPIPSGRIERRRAMGLGYALLVSGLVVGLALGYLASSPRTAALSAALLLSVWLYDRFLKDSPVGPLNMGLCRTLNVLLGMSLLVGPWQMPHYLIAGGIGLYIVGVTLFARNEATESSRLGLVAAMFVMVAGLATLAAYPQLAQLTQMPTTNWYLLWGLLALSIGHRASRAVAEPSPMRVQVAVRHCLLSLIVINATLTYAICGLPAALLILALLTPTLLLGMWIRST